MLSEQEICYECSCILIDDRDALEISTWIYLGFVKTSCGSIDCEVPNHFHKFAKLEDYSRSIQDPAFELPHIFITTTQEVRKRFLNREAMIESANMWHQQLLADKL